MQTSARRRGAQYPKELANWALVSVGVGAVEGAVAAEGEAGVIRTRGAEGGRG